MKSLKFNYEKCDFCGKCADGCPFGAINMGEGAIELTAACRMCSVCIKSCSTGAIYIEQEEEAVDKASWRDILVFAEQENGVVHNVTYELIGKARELAGAVGYKVNALMIAGPGGSGPCKDILRYGVDNVYVYEHPGYETFKADSWANAAADCIAASRPSVVLFGATPLGRSLAPRVSTRFRTGLTADCTVLKMKEDTDLVQIRPAFGGNIMAEILISGSRPQFATVRYKVMDTAKPVEGASGRIVHRAVTDAMACSGIEVTEAIPIPKAKSIEEEEVLVVAGRGVRDDAGVAMLEELAVELGGRLCFSRPMVEAGRGDPAHQIGLSGRTVKPKLIITCGVSGAIQFTSCMQESECIVAINSDPDAQIFNVAHYCIAEDLYGFVPALLKKIRKGGK
ncbi:MAG: electron transfer flavoprotein subunit alpha [Clostridiales bacterium]|nr:electron transfer flavoprotein subunit alpha [Clostridiales bacterium]